MLDRKEPIKNPKVTNRRPWYPYYAGFSEEFVENAIDRLAPAPNSMVLDPWNGSGTTTLVAARSGFRTHGIDINPALVLVSKARSASFADWQVANAQAAALGPALAPNVVLPEVDPLRSWFGPAAVETIRRLESIGWSQFASSRPATAQISKVSPRLTLWYAALFLTVRKLIVPAIGTNPTWTRQLHSSRALKPRPSTIVSRFAESLHHFGPYLKGERGHDNWQRTSVRIGSSTNLDIETRTVDAIITSPPYCTRLDYGVYCAPEIAVVGPSFGISLHELRREMIGSPLVGRDSRPVDHWGPTASLFLARVLSHTSKASTGYYYNYFLRYFTEMKASFGELSRVATSDCSLLLVVQGSFYKEVYLDLPAVFVEMLTCH